MIQETCTSVHTKQDKHRIWIHSMLILYINPIIQPNRNKETGLQVTHSKRGISKSQISSQRKRTALKVCFCHLSSLKGCMLEGCNDQLLLDEHLQFVTPRLKDAFASNILKLHTCYRTVYFTGSPYIPKICHIKWLITLSLIFYYVIS